MGRLLDSVDLTTYRAARPETSSNSQAFSGRMYDVDPDTGFFPSQPLRPLSGEFSLWERGLVDARGVLKLGVDRGQEAFAKCALGEQWRQRLRSWPVVDARKLGDKVRTLRRAHYVLTCLLHFYVHSLPSSQVQGQIIIPRPLAVPLVAVSQKLMLPPILTFADIVLWNWEFIDPEQPLSLNNMRYVNVFSGTETETNFYLLSAAAELKGVEMLRIIERVVNVPCPTTQSAIAAIKRDFEELVRVIDELTIIIGEASKTVHPNTFYWAARPWWNGSDAAAPWVFEGVPPSSFDLGGASAGQSSVMHALDAFLDVDHGLKQTRQPAPSAENRRSDTSFMEKMRRYMPEEHRAYLAQLQKRHVRDLVQRVPALREHYNMTVAALKKFRDIHIRIGTLFIISQAKSTPPASMGSVEVEGNESRSKGTGGNPVSTLLKAGRDATQRTLLRDE
ncbi:Indoleamine 2,3-dioxygenase [Lentinus tigrinus ALCF2SS1-6]|uniref:Indoleamine 2,3-dioxygenase n=2 Tax=Lentinus tigrinus TaxID=5365 RepID=A0A5C2ST25_9APHY|nr:Indoleamine 2,3-dioxygenase [Lentinus tigrinus ALCF2SS1-6]